MIEKPDTEIEENHQRCFYCQEYFDECKCDDYISEEKGCQLK